MKVIYTERAPEPIGTYSQALQIKNLVFLSGQTGIKPGAMGLCSADFADQAKQIFENILAIAEKIDLDLSHVIKLTIFLKDLNDFAELNEVMKAYFAQPYPARSTVQVSRLPKDALVEVEAILAV